MTAISWRHWNMWAESWSGWILATLFDTTVALVVVLGIWLLVRRHVSPRWCYLLFLLVPLKMLVPVELPWLPEPFAPTMRRVEAPAVARDEVAVPPRPTMEEMSAERTNRQPAKPARTAATPSASLPDTREPGPTVLTLLMLSWAGVVLLLMGRLVWSQIAMMRRLRDAQPVAWTTDEGSSSAAERKLGPCVIQLWISESMSVPGVVGLFRPCIVLPAKLYSNLSPKQLQCILAHELHHIRWRDMWVALGERLVRIIQFYNPVLWCAAYLTHVYRERSCDDASLLAVAMDRRLYGSTLLAVLECAQADRVAAPPSVALLERSGDHKRRMRQIMTGKVGGLGPGLWSVCTLCVVAVIVLPNLRPASALPGEAGTREVTVDEQEDAAASQSSKVVIDWSDEEDESTITLENDGEATEVSHDVTGLVDSHDQAEELANLITTHVLPRTWERTGGKGTVSIDFENRKLRTTHCADAQKGVGLMLKAMKAATQLAKISGAVLHEPNCFDLFQQDGQTTVVVSVSTLVRPNGPRVPPRGEDYDELIRMTTNVIDCDSWPEVGGAASISVWPAGECVVVTQSREAAPRLFHLYSLLNRLRNTISDEATALPVSISLPDSWAANLGNQLASQENGVAAKNFETRVYSFPDLLPSTSTPTLSDSPRGVGVEQITSWLCQQVFTAQSDEWFAAATFVTKAALILTADSAAHQRAAVALTDVRTRLGNAQSEADRAAVLRPLLAPAYSEFWSGSPGVTYDWSPNRIYLHGVCQADQQLRQLTGVGDYLQQVALIESDVSDEGVRTLAQIGRIAQVKLWSDRVTDEGVGHLAALIGLQSLSLQSAFVTDAAVPRLAELKSLWWLDISRTAITAAGVKSLLESSESLRHTTLVVRQSQVDPDGLESLRKLCLGLRIVDY